MAGNRYAALHDTIAANPAPIERQISRINSEIERFATYRLREIQTGRKHPDWGAAQLYELRSILVTLQRVKEQRDAYAQQREQAA